MSSFIIKGTVFGFSYNDWKDDPTVFSSNLISVVQNWVIKNYDNHANLKIETTEKISREYGKIRNAVVGFQNDIHNLSVNFDLMNNVMKDSSKDEGFKSLYLGLLFENYITNIRSLYDFTAFFPRILLEEKEVHVLSSLKNSDSLNAVLKYCKKNKDFTKNVLPERIVELVLSIESELEDIRTIRDTIIHKGKDPFVNSSNEQILIKVPKEADYASENFLPNLLNLNTSDEYPMFDYLKILTWKLIYYMEKLGQIIGDQLHEKNQDYRTELVGLVGICMEGFVKYVYNG